ncbi:STAS domain-containing protein [Streptomyces sp. NPDC091272]|uniref:STAS domain-containing protein n=1 Tax=Streptomyces sp. NPDC091272 TaxID=3365981 RepID=UPI0038088307
MRTPKAHTVQVHPASARTAQVHGEGWGVVTRNRFTSRTAVHEGVARVILTGELDLDASPHVRAAVADALAKRPTALFLDLTGVSFCDCAGLNALLRARLAVLRAGTDLLVEGICAQLARLISLIGADDILVEHGRQADAHPARRTSDVITSDVMSSDVMSSDVIAIRHDTAMATAEVPLRDLLT